MPANVLTHCPNCKARLEQHGARFCAYCGAALPRPVEAVLTGEEHQRRRFEALQQHPDLQRLLRHEPSTAGAALGGVALAVFGGVFTLVALFMLGVFGFVGHQAHAPGVVRLFPLLFVGVGIFVVTRGISTSTKMTTGAWTRVPARVVDERVRVSGGGNNSSASTSYYVSLEAADGSREEYPTTARVAGKVAPDDLGVAYVRGGMLVDFQRLRV